MPRLDYWIRRSPFFDAALRAGAGGFAIANHMYQPNGYDTAEAEYWKLVHGVVLWDVGTERQVEVSGPDAAAFVSRLTPRDLSKVLPGRCRYSLVTSASGGIVNDPVVLRLAEDRYWMSCSDTDLLLWVSGIAVNAGMDVQVREPDVSPVQVQGPRSREVMQVLFGDAIAELGWYRLRETELDGIPVVVTRTGWTGGPGYEIFLRDSRSGDELWQRILDAGAPFDIAMTGPSDMRRVEAGILAYHSDMNLATNPFELGLERLVDLAGGHEFIGREALVRVASEGVSRRLVGIDLGPAPLPGDFDRRWPLYLGAEPVGEVTIAVYSPRLERAIGYAMVWVEAAREGTALVAHAPWGERGATVAPGRRFLTESQ